MISSHLLICRNNEISLFWLDFGKFGSLCQAVSLKVWIQVAKENNNTSSFPNATSISTPIWFKSEIGHIVTRYVTEVQMSYK